MKKNDKNDKALYATIEMPIKHNPVNRGSKLTITADTWLDMDNNNSDILLIVR